AVSKIRSAKAQAGRSRRYVARRRKPSVEEFPAMNSVSTRVSCVVAALLAALVQGPAQERASAAAGADPRVGLKAGLRDAGEAASNMKRIATLPKPEGFFDP